MRLHSSMKTLLSPHTLLNLSWLNKPTELLRQYQVSKAVNGSLYGCKAQQPSCKRKFKPPDLKNGRGQFYIIFTLCYVTGLLFFLLASSPKIQVVSINFISRPGVCQEPAAPAEPLLAAWWGAHWSRRCSSSSALGSWQASAHTAGVQGRTGKRNTHINVSRVTRVPRHNKRGMLETVLARQV